jgi:sugar phosphate isomerase/epimerase
VVAGIRNLAEEARKVGLRIGIEPMREANRPRWTLVCSLAETLDLLEEVGDDDVGIIFDTWHMWDSDDVHNMIGVAIDRIHGVQIADYRDPTRSSLDRVAAGQGIAGIDRLVDEFRSAGYDGWYDLEIFSDDGRFVNDFPDSLWKLDPLEYARVQVEGFMSCWS